MNEDILSLFRLLMVHNHEQNTIIVTALNVVIRDSQGNELFSLSIEADDHSGE